MNEKFELRSGDEVDLQLLNQFGCQFLINAYRLILDGKEVAACYSCDAKLLLKEGKVIIGKDWAGCLAKVREVSRPGIEPGSEV